MRPKQDSRDELLKFFDAPETKKVIAGLHERVLSVSSHLEHAIAAEPESENDLFDFRGELESLLSDARDVEAGKLHPAYSEAVKWALNERFVSVESAPNLGVNEVFKVLVRSSFGPLPPFTGQELAQQFSRFLRIPLQSFDDGYALMAAAVLDSCDDRTETLCEESAGMPESWQAVPLRMDARHFNLTTAISQHDMRSGYWCELDLKAFASEAAFQNAVDRLRPIGQTVLRNLACLGPQGYCELETLQTEQYVASDCLSSFFTPAAKGDKFGLRLRNALEALVLADQQESLAVAFALDVICIEALLGEGKGELSEKIARAIAALLEPNRLQRDSAFRKMKKMYGCRSTVLHGSSFDIAPEDRDCVRGMAAAVVHAVVERRSFMEKSGHGLERHTDFMADLTRLGYDDGLLAGITERPVTRWWRENLGP